MAKKIKLGLQEFDNRRQAVTFLQNNPFFVKHRIGNLSKGSPKLLKDAGYTLSQVTPGGPGTGLKKKWQLVDKGGEIIARWNQLPEPMKTAPGVGKHAGPGATATSAVESARTQWRDNRGTITKARGAGKGPGPAVEAGAGAPAVAGPDIAALAESMGVDPGLLMGISPKVGNLIPLALAGRGANPMDPAQINALVQSMIGDQYKSRLSVMGQERARTEAQNAHNLEQIRHWYDQVIGSQGVAAQRDEAFGKAAVASAQSSTEAIINALGGEANPGSYVAGAAGQENIGNLNAIGTIQNEYNADIAPLLQGEAAGQLTREQGLGSDRLKELSMRLQELQSQRGSDEAQMRYNIWQSNNDILDRRLQNELAIRQANTGLLQQRFQNRMGVNQAIISAQAGNAANAMNLAKLGVDVQQGNQAEAGRNARANLRAALDYASIQSREHIAALRRKGAGKTYATAGDEARDSASTDIINALQPKGGKKLSTAQAIQVATAVANGYGWSVKNMAVQSMVRDALRQAGYDV